jgi:hypothetical protein
MYLAFGEVTPVVDPAHGGTLSWGFSLSSDLLTWSEPVIVLDPRWSTTGNATATTLSPMPGRWVVPTDGPPTAPHWVQPDGDYKYKAACGPCPAVCEVCPGMGELCSQAVHISRDDFDAIPTASVDFSCGLVSKLQGYSGYIYPTLVDDSHHVATGSDPSLNVVGQTANVFFVANPCAGTLPWKPAGNAQMNGLKCTILDSKGRTRRNIVRSGKYASNRLSQPCKIHSCSDKLRRDSSASLWWRGPGGRPGRVNFYGKLSVLKPLFSCRRSMRGILCSPIHATVHFN